MVWAAVRWLALLALLLLPRLGNVAGVVSVPSHPPTHPPTPKPTAAPSPKPATPAVPAAPGKPTPLPTKQTHKPTPTAMLTRAPTSYEFFNEVQSMNGPMLGTVAYLSNCIHDCGSVAVCPEFHANGCRDAQYLVLGDQKERRVTVYRRPAEIGFSQSYVQVTQPGAGGMPQYLNWTGAVGDFIVVNKSAQGAVAMFIDKSADSVAYMQGNVLLSGDLLAIGSPGDSRYGSVNIYSYSPTSSSFVWTQRILPPTTVPVGMTPPLKIKIGAGLSMGLKVLAVGNLDKYVYVYRYTQTGTRWAYSLEASLCVCGCAATTTSSTSKTLSACTSLAMPQDATRLIVADAAVGSPTGTSAPNAGLLHIYTPSVTTSTSTGASVYSWSQSQTLNVANQCAGLSSTAFAGYGCVPSRCCCCCSCCAPLSLSLALCSPPHYFPQHFYSQCVQLWPGHRHHGHCRPRSRELLLRQQRGRAPLHVLLQQRHVQLRRPDPPGLARLYEGHCPGL